MVGGVVFALDGVGIDGQAQHRADMGLIHLAAHDFHLGKQGRGGLAGLQDAVEVVIAVPISPIFGVDVHFQAVFSAERCVCGAADQLHPEVEGMIADILHAHLLGHDIAGDDVDTLGGEIRAIGGFFVNLQTDIAGGYHIGGLTDGGIVSQGGLGQHGQQNRSQGDEQELGFCFHVESSFRFILSAIKRHRNRCPLIAAYPHKGDRTDLLKFI